MPVGDVFWYSFEVSNLRAGNLKKGGWDEI